MPNDPRPAPEAPPSEAPPSAPIVTPADIYADPAYLRVLGASRDATASALHAQGVWADYVSRRVTAELGLLRATLAEDRALEAAADLPPARRGPELYAARAALAGTVEHARQAVASARADEAEAGAEMQFALAVAGTAHAAVTRYFYARLPGGAP